MKAHFKVTLDLVLVMKCTAHGKDTCAFQSYTMAQSEYPNQFLLQIKYCGVFRQAELARLASPPFTPWRTQQGKE
jgi:hypothetical protein